MIELDASTARRHRRVVAAWRYPSLEDFLTSEELTVDGRLDDGWGASVLVKGRELEAAILFADIAGFSHRTKDMSPTETLIYVNTFFAWITAEALRHGRGVIDKYIGDEVMVVFAREFGSEDPFADAVDTARWICENDVLDYGPHIGIASGPVVVGYVGTPIRHNCSVFGAPVALAARCAGVPQHLKENDFAIHTITFCDSDWGQRPFAQMVPPSDQDCIGDRNDKPAQTRWSLTDPFPAAMKNLGDVLVRQIMDVNFLRINQNFSAESRARDGLEALRTHNRYWPDGRERRAARRT